MSTETPFHRRHLPHFYPPDAVYLITSRLADSLPPSVIERARKEREILESQDSKGKRRSSGLPPYIVELEWWEKVIERGSKNARWLADPRIADLVAEAIRYRDGKDYNLVAYSIMPNHMHLVFGIGSPDLLELVGQIDNLSNLSDKPVSKIMQSLKRHTARAANKILGRRGAFWQDESYDHVIRNSEELERIVLYVLHNPVNAGLVIDWRDWKWSFSRFEI